MKSTKLNYGFTALITFVIANNKTSITPTKLTYSNIWALAADKLTHFSGYSDAEGNHSMLFEQNLTLQKIALWCHCSADVTGKGSPQVMKLYCFYLFQCR